MQNPRSAYIAFEAFPRPKGASSHMASMVTALARNNGPVLLLCLGFGDMPSFQIEGDIMIKRFKAYHPNMLKRAMEFSHYVFDCLEQHGSDLELCVFRDPWGGAPALSGHGNITAVFEVNALPSWELAYSYPGFSTNYALKHKIMDMEHFCLNHCHGILTVSPVTQSALARKGVPENKITCIPNSAPDVFFSPPSTEVVPDCLLSGSWFGYFGSLHTWQGIEDAVMAFSMITEKFPAVNMVIITGGRKEAKKRLRKQIRKQGLEKRIRLMPPVAPEKLAAILGHLEFTLAPLKDTPRNTRQGCCPVKIIESMAAGVPVIASELSCVEPLITHNHDGLLVTPGKLRALALAIQHCLENKSKTQKMGARARLKARAEYKRDHIHAKLDHCFHTIKTLQGVNHEQSTRAYP